jgi:hypothetical protein
MIYLITPTGNRPDQFITCVKLMQRQTYAGDVTWIIVDDCVPISTDIVKEDFREKWTIIKVYPEPIWTPGQNTQFRNMLACIKALEDDSPGKDIEAVFIIEDDDYYKPWYLQEMVKRMGTYDIIGEVNTLYYNVRHRKYSPMNNYQHSSLFQTVISAKGIPFLKSACNRPPSGDSFFIDITIWREIQNKNLFNAGNVAIGIKGMPGRSGLGSGHNDNSLILTDHNMDHLRLLMGEDSKLYEGYFDGQYVQLSAKEERRKARRMRKPTIRHRR